MTPKKNPVSTSLERHVRATREHTWHVLLREIESGTGEYADPGKPHLVETVLSFEPPWRRAYQVDGDTGLDLYQGTFTIRDDGDECHLAWSVVVNPDPSPEGQAFLDLAIAEIDTFLDRVVTAAQV